MATNPLLEAALSYQAMGLHPIPCRPRNKIPIVNWKDFQTTMPTTEQIRAWWTRTPDANVALVLGRGMFAVDLDGGLDAEELLADQGILLSLDAPRSKTGGGYHVFFRATRDVPDRVGLLSTNGGKPQVDIRGKGIVVAPPSIHPNGTPYEWMTPLSAGLSDPPAPLLALIDARAQTSPPLDAPAPGTVPHGDAWVEDTLRGVGEGHRDAACTRLAGYFLGKGLDPSVVTAMLCESFARNCRPEFSPADVRKCVQSIARREQLVEQTDHAIVPEHISAPLARMEMERAAGPAPALRTPYRVLNKLLSGGFSPGELIYVGARPGVGKTALALEVARVSAKAGAPVLVISREMRNAALVRRMMAQEARVAATAIKMATLSGDDFARYQHALAQLKDLPIWMTDRAVSLGEIVSALDHTPREPKLLVVDYLQLVRAPKGITDRRLQVEEVSKNLKTLALQREIPVLCLSSLSRPQKGSPDPKPSLADLRESGELEHDCDIALLLHRPFQSLDATCIVAKNREGSTGEVPLRFTPECVSFAAVAEASEFEPSPVSLWERH